MKILDEIAVLEDESAKSAPQAGPAASSGPVSSGGVSVADINERCAAREQGLRSKSA